MREMTVLVPAAGYTGFRKPNRSRCQTEQPGFGLQAPGAVAFPGTKSPRQFGFASDSEASVPGKPFLLPGTARFLAPRTWPESKSILPHGF